MRRVVWRNSAAEDDGATRAGPFNEIRAARVVAKVRTILDDVVPLTNGSHTDATLYACADGALAVTLMDGSQTGLETRRLCRLRWPRNTLAVC